MNAKELYSTTMDPEKENYKSSSIMKTMKKPVKC